MKKPLLVLAGGIAALALLAGLATAFPFAAIFSGCPGIPAAASHRLGGQERLGKMRRRHRRNGELAVEADLGMCRHAYVRQRSRPERRATHVTGIGRPPSARLRRSVNVDSVSWFGKHQSMKEGPDVSIVAALIGDPARANMLMALMSGLALSGTELAAEAGVTLSTASGHLAKLERAGLVTRKQARSHPLFPFRRSRRCSRGRGSDPDRHARRPSAYASRSARPGDAPGAIVLRPSRRATGGLPARTLAGAQGAAPKRQKPCELTPSGRRHLERLAVSTSPPSSAPSGRSAGPASTGANGGGIWAAAWAPPSSITC